MASMFFRRGGRLDVSVLRKAHSAFSVMARNTPCLSISDQCIVAELQRLRLWLSETDGFEAHVHILSKVALSADGKMKAAMIHHEWNFFTQVRELLRTVSVATANFGTFNAFLADTAHITFSTAKVTASSLCRPGDPNAGGGTRLLPQRAPSVRGPIAPTLPKRTRHDVAAHYGQVNYSVVSDEGTKKVFKVIDLSGTPPLASYYKWPALIDAGTGHVADPLTWLKWGDVTADIVVPELSPSLVAAASSTALWSLSGEDEEEDAERGACMLQS